MIEPLTFFYISRVRVQASAKSIHDSKVSIVKCPMVDVIKTGPNPISLRSQ